MPYGRAGSHIMLFNFSSELICYSSEWHLIKNSFLHKNVNEHSYLARCSCLLQYLWIMHILI